VAKILVPFFDALPFLSISPCFVYHGDFLMRVFGAMVLVLSFAIFDSRVLPDWANFIKAADAQVQRVCLNNRNGRLVSRANCRGARFTPVSAELLQNFATLEQGPQGPQGPQGVQGEPGGFVPFLPSGELLTGNFGGFFTPTQVSQRFGVNHTFAFPLTEEPEVFLIPKGGTPPEECPGTAEFPDATPGSLCLYEVANDNSSNMQVWKSTASLNRSDLTGFVYEFSSTTDSSLASSAGYYAVRAP